jgi:hypothetical protein
VISSAALRDAFEFAVKDVCVFSRITMLTIANELPNTVSTQQCTTAAWLHDVFAGPTCLNRCSIHLLPEVEISETAINVRGCTNAPQNNLPPPVHGLA